MKKLIAIVAVATLGGCAASSVIPMDRGTYLITQTWPTMGFQAPTHATATVYAKANEFCAQKGMQVDTINLSSFPSAMGRPSSASLQFRCVPPDDSVAPQSVGQPEPGAISSFSYSYSH